MGEFAKIFRKVNGLKVLSQYWKGHVLFHALFSTLLEGTDRKSLEIVRLSTENRLGKNLRKKYRKYIDDFKNANQECSRGTNPPIIWFCWLQGIDNAPEIVRMCYESIKQINGYAVKVITFDNINDYINLPPFIVNKHKRGIIGNAHFADIIRLELLIKHGGTWIDSTVFCSNKHVPDFYLKSDLFVYRILKPGLDGHYMSSSNWFISARQNNKVLRLTRNLLYEYWKKHNDVIDYYIFHYFFELALEAYPEEAAHIPPVSSEPPHMLLLRLFDIYDENIYRSIMEQTCFHKLTYKFEDGDIEKDNTYYRHIMSLKSDRHNSLLCSEL